MTRVNDAPPRVTAVATTYPLLAYDLDMTVGLLTLQFPMTMRSRSLNASALVIQDRAGVTATGWG